MKYGIGKIESNLRIRKGDLNDAGLNLDLDLSLEFSLD